MTVIDGVDDRDGSTLARLIGFSTLSRPLESWYAYVSRLIRANLLNDLDIRQQLPAEWVRWAFEPQHVRGQDLARLDPYRHKVPEADLKLRPAAWQPFSALSSTPPECLRACPECLKFGYHSYAFQGDSIARCPVHEAELVHRCPQCETPLLWHARSPSSSAFHCPAGCPLLDGNHSGLYLPYETEITSGLRQHWAWTESLRQTIEMVSGPVHIAYPPYLAVASMRTPPLPSKGLQPALLHALQGRGWAQPAFAPYQEQSHGRWTLAVQPWGAHAFRPCSEARAEAYRRAFRRGVYRTHVPLVDRSAFEEWLAASEAAHGKWHHGGVEEGSPCATFALPSYLVTNNELIALRRLLARGSDLHLACAHYQQALVELLENARLRRIGLDQLAEPSEHVIVAEAFDAVVRTPSGTWRVTGRTHGDNESRGYWLDFREPAEIDNGLIHVMRRHAPR